MKEFFEESAAVLGGLVDLEPICQDVVSLIKQVVSDGGTILVGGNGGSCADSLHFVGELTCTYKKPTRAPINAICLSANPAAITAWSNDFGFETFFARQVAAHGKQNDLLILISTGGGSRSDGFSSNLVLAAEQAKELGITVVALVGKGGGVLKEIADLSLHVKSDSTALVQQAHITLIHAICEGLEDLTS